MTRTKAILVAAFLLAFAAGTSVGLYAVKPPPAQAPPPPPPSRGGPVSMLTKELGLTNEQREAIEKIWKEVWRPGGGGPGGPGGPGGRDERRAALVRERDQAILALLSDEQKARYEAIQQDFNAKVEALQQERMKAFEKSFETAREKTRALLSDAQRAKYDEMTKRWPERGPGGPGGPGGPPGRGPRHRHTAPTSGPASMESNTPHVGE